MSAKISGNLPKGDANGIGPIVQELVDQPHRFHVLLAIVDCSVLPMELEDEITMAFGRVDPRTGEIFGDDEDGSESQA